MTNPYAKLIPQIEWIGENGFDYVDLAVEPPAAHVADIDPSMVKKAAQRHELDIIVHTSPYLPIANRHPGAKTAACNELIQTIDLAKAIESPLMTIHYLGAPPYYTLPQVADIYAELINQLVEYADGLGIEIAIENSPINNGEAHLLREIFKRAPKARFLLDIGHIHLKTENDLMDGFLNDPILGDRLTHIHLSDNNGYGDLHLPLGSVRNGIDWEKTISKVRRHPYDGRFTLEVFSPDPDYLLLSREKLIHWWSA